MAIWGANSWEKTTCVSLDENLCYAGNVLPTTAPRILFLEIAANFPIASQFLSVSIQYF